MSEDAHDHARLLADRARSQYGRGTRLLALPAFTRKRSQGSSHVGPTSIVSSMGAVVIVEKETKGS